jgi:hypothetical protein
MASDDNDSIPIFAKSIPTRNNDDDECTRREITATSDLSDLLDFKDLKDPPRKNDNDEKKDSNNNNDDDEDEDFLTDRIVNLRKYAAHEALDDVAFVCDHFLSPIECDKIIKATEKFGYGKTNYHQVIFVLLLNVPFVQILYFLFFCVEIFIENSVNVNQY